MVHNNTNEIFTSYDQTDKQNKECNSTISQFPILAIGKSRGAQKIGGVGQGHRQN